LMAFGGAGPLHAAEVGRALRIGRVVIPSGPGVFSAAGLLGAEIELHSCRTVVTYERDNDPALLRAALDEMKKDLVQRLRDEGFEEHQVVATASVDICYRGQSSELTVPLASLEVTQTTLQKAIEAFEHEYERTYGHRGDNKRFDIVNARMVATVIRLAQAQGMRPQEPKQLKEPESRQAYFGPGKGLMQTRVVSRTALAKGAVAGPLIVQEYDSTVVIPPDCTAALDAYGNIVIDVREAAPPVAAGRVGVPIEA